MRKLISTAATIGLLSSGVHKATAGPATHRTGDADYVARVVHSVQGPVILVGHSYGGETISVAGDGPKNVKGPVLVARLASDAGESAASLGERFPTGTLGQALTTPMPQADGPQDLDIQQH